MPNPLLNFVVEEFAARALTGMEDWAERNANYRSVIIKLPVEVQGRDLYELLKSWHRLLPEEERPREERFLIPKPVYDKLGSGVVDSHGENNFTLAFFNEKSSFWSPNWPQITSVLYREVSDDTKYLIVSSSFVRTQLMERGILVKNCASILEVVEGFCKSRGVDFMPNLREAQWFMDSFSEKVAKYDRRLSWWQALLMIPVGILIIAGVGFLILWLSSLRY